MDRKNFWENKRIMVTGGAGFLGGYVVEKLKQKGCKEIFIPRSKNYNLIEMEAVKRLYRDSNPSIVIHLAARMGGLGAQIKSPGEFFYENIMMGTQMMEQGRIFGTEKFIALASTCSYPEYAPIPFKEKDLWDGYPEKASAPYGLAKKMLLVQSQAYRQQYGFNSICLFLVNSYGPRDNFDSKSFHIIPALIKNCIEAIKENKNEIIIWGTGNATREFLYAGDTAEAIILAAEKYNKSDPVNVGTGYEISIKNLAKLVASLTGFKGEIVCDRSKPDGQPRRTIDVSRAEKEFDFKARVSLEEGLKKTIEWYKNEML